MNKWIDDKNSIGCISLISKERLSNLVKMLNLKVLSREVPYRTLRNTPIPRYTFNKFEERGWWVCGSKILTPVKYWRLVGLKQQVIPHRVNVLISSLSKRGVTKPIEIRVVKDLTTGKKCCVDGGHRLLALEHLYQKNKKNPRVTLITLSGNKLNYLYPCEYLKLSGGHG